MNFKQRILMELRQQLHSLLCDGRVVAPDMARFYMMRDKLFIARCTKCKARWELFGAQLSGRFKKP